MSTVRRLSAWLRPMTAPREGAPLLLCLPHAGGSPSFYRPLADLVGREVDVWSVQYPGRHDRYREPFAESVEDLAEAITTELLEHADGRDLVLFGHSMGSIVGFESVHRLEASGRAVAHLVVSGRRAPSQRVARGFAAATDRDLAGELARLAGTDAEVLGEPEFLDVILPAVRADYRLAEAYSCSPSVLVDAPITGVCGVEDPLAPPDAVLRWSTHTSAGPVDVHVLPGGHFYLLDQAAEVADILLGICIR